MIPLKRTLLDAGTRILTGVLTFVLTLGLALGMPVWALEIGEQGFESPVVISADPGSRQVAPEKLSDIHPDMSHYRKRWWRKINRIFQFDSEPLGDRIPVIMIPGRAEEFQHNAWWKDLQNDMEDQDAFVQNYKPYVYIYDSSQELDVQAGEFVAEVKRHFKYLSKDRPMVLVTYSLGGLIAQEALKDPEIEQRTQRVFAIAVPFHGSPLFDPDWFTQYMKHPSPIRTLWDRFLYRTYLFNKSNLTRGLKWDNFDSSKPMFDRELTGDQVTSHIDTYAESDHTGVFKRRLIIYASYLENSYTHSNQPYQKRKLPWYVMNNSVKLPKELVGTVLPFYGFTVHSVFTYMNHQLSNIPTYTPEHPEGKNTHLYRFNDGAIPLSSMLYLPARSAPYDDDLEGLIQALDIPQDRVRIFVNLDHMHIGSYSLFDSRLRSKDILHPELGERPPNQWVVYDLIQMLPELKPETPHRITDAVLSEPQ